MISARKVWFLFVTMYVTFSTYDVTAKSLGFEKRDLNSDQITSCSQQPFRQFMTEDGCRLCTNCTKLGLYTLQGCTNWHDAVCEDRCLDEDAKYDAVIKMCRKLKRKHEITFNEKTTSGTVVHDKNDSTEDMKTKVANKEDNWDVIIAATVGSCATVTVIAICVGILLKRKCFANKRIDAHIYDTISDTSDNPNRGRPLPKTPTSTGYPCSSVSDSEYDAVVL